MLARLLGGGSDWAGATRSMVSVPISRDTLPERARPPESWQDPRRADGGGSLEGSARGADFLSFLSAFSPKDDCGRGLRSRRRSIGNSVTGRAPRRASRGSSSPSSASGASSAIGAAAGAEAEEAEGDAAGEVDWEAAGAAAGAAVRADCSTTCTGTKLGSSLAYRTEASVSVERSASENEEAVSRHENAV